MPGEKITIHIRRLRRRKIRPPWEEIPRTKIQEPNKIQKIKSQSICQLPMNWYLIKR